ncbi:MAG: sulfurtransferase TusA family protein [Candidatus Bathyarchaeia archaeon]|jgi:tRNA 2-thiouridine synthesizing protein A
MNRLNLDCRGKTCPWPAFLTKEHLKKMQTGDVLEVLVDYAPARENVERIAKSDGNKILEVKVESALIRILIEKA